MKWFGGLFERIPFLRRRVILNLIDHQTVIRGVLYEKRGPWLVLKDASLLQASGPAVPMDGDVVIECAQVLFTQVGS